MERANIERLIARALAEADGFYYKPESMIEAMGCTRDARYLLTALSAAGLVIVPREPTDDMLVAMRNIPTAGTADLGFRDYYADEWQAGIAASGSDKVG